MLYHVKSLMKNCCLYNDIFFTLLYGIVLIHTCFCSLKEINSFALLRHDTKEMGLIAVQE